jgi:CubicO group peptidase (beta-lactamase class C family)
MDVLGSCDARFALVREEFERNLAEREEVGASLCVTVEGDRVVDLWGGIADPATARPWAGDTVATVMSCTKGATALCAHLLADRGQLSLDAPVCRYWPEFGKRGKAGVTVRMLLNHQAGLPHVRAWVPEGGICDWDAMVALVEDEEPFWEPGTRQGYHALTFGWLVGEVVRRISGRSLGRFFAEEVAGPLDLDFWIGLPHAQERRVAPLLPAPPPDPDKPLPRIMRAVFSDPQSIPGLVVLNNGGWFGAPDAPQYRAAELGATNGITNARGLAGLYRPVALGGMADGVKLMEETTVARMGITSSASLVDATTLFSMRFGLGFHKSIDNRSNPAAPDANCIIGEGAFGHSGLGGSMGFADPRARMSFGYVMNQMGPGVMPNERGQSLVDATYRALGYRTNEPGAWV